MCARQHLRPHQEAGDGVSGLAPAQGTADRLRGKRLPTDRILDLGRWTGSWSTRLYGLAKEMLDL